MANMDPAQLEMMSKQSGMSADSIKAAQQQMKSMSPEMIRQQQEQFKNMSPAERDAQLKMQQDRASYALGGANSAKEEGNRLFKAGKYPEAIERYERALEAAVGTMLSSPEAVTLKKACRLNLASCYLKTGADPALNKCIKACSEVITDDPRNLKAHYRRAQANRQLGHNEQAIRDARVALEMNPKDDTVATLVKAAPNRKHSTLPARNPALSLPLPSADA